MQKFAIFVLIVQKIACLRLWVHYTYDRTSKCALYFEIEIGNNYVINPSLQISIPCAMCTGFGWLYSCLSNLSWWIPFHIKIVAQWWNHLELWWENWKRNTTTWVSHIAFRAKPANSTEQKSTHLYLQISQDHKERVVWEIDKKGLVDIFIYFELGIGGCC